MKVRRARRRKVGSGNSTFVALPIVLQSLDKLPFYYNTLLYYTLFCHVFIRIAFF